MNAPWVSWGGQEPEAYRAAFDKVAAALRASLPDPVMVWSPTAEKDYPFQVATSTPPKGVPPGIAGHQRERCLGPGRFRI